MLPVIVQLFHVFTFTCILAHIPGKCVMQGLELCVLLKIFLSQRLLVVAWFYGIDSACIVSY